MKRISSLHYSVLVLYLFSLRTAEAQGPSLSPSFRPSMPNTLSPSQTSVPTSTPSSKYSAQPTKNHAPTTSSAPTTFCFTNTTLLAEEIDLKSPFEYKTYILCPNTVFHIGFPSGPGDCCTDGDSYLPTQSRTTVICGLDGSLDNNCTVMGGFQQIVGFSSERVEEVIFKGITFSSAKSNTVVFSIFGSVLFEDCMFKDTRNNGGMIRSEWGFYDDIPGNTFAGTRLVLSFKHCNFEGNSFGAVSGGNPTGLIFARSQATELILEDSSFENNVFSLQQVQINGYLVQSPGNVTIHRSCFRNNAVDGLGLVQLPGKPATNFSENAGSNNGNLKCLFAVEYDNTSVALERNEYTCIPFDREACFGVPTTAPTTPPTSSPLALSGSLSSRRQWTALIGGLVILATIWLS